MYGKLDHAAIKVADLNASLEFFQSVFDMTIVKQAGTAPNRKVWLAQGIQLNETPVPASGIGILDHIAICTNDMSAVLREVERRKLPLLPGKDNWFVLDCGLVIELVAVKSEA